MLILPAIDLLGGACVRLHQGAYESQRVYDTDPVSVARSFEVAGARWIHVVDLDAARAGSAREPAGPATDGKTNREALRLIRSSVGCKIEVGGGIRTEQDVQELLEAGVDRLILGTVLVRDPDLVAGWVARFGRVFVAGIDARDGQVRVSGWTGAGGMADLDLAGRCKDLGMRGVVYTNISRDGTLEGPDLQRTALVAQAAGLPTLVSGGVASLEDLLAVTALPQESVAGSIVGKALYERRIDLHEACRRIPQAAEEAERW